MKIQQFFAKVFISALLTILIVSTSRAKVPFSEAKGIYEATKDEYKYISPFWAMVATHGNLLEHIRLFGFYEKGKDGYDVLLDQQDRIASLLLNIFLRPTGLELVVNARDDFFKNLRKEGNLIQVNNIIEILLDTDKNESEKIESITKIVKSLTNDTDTIKKFPTLLVKAYNQQKVYANPNNPDQQRYPENIVIISLLSFVVEVARDKIELIESLPLFFKEKEEIDMSIYSIDDYYNIRRTKSVEKENEKFIEFIEEITKIIKDPKQIELTFFMAKGFENYERLVAEPIKYLQQTVCIKEGTKSFSDCGENSLRNVFMLLLSAGNGGIVSLENINTLESKLDLIDNIVLSSYQPYIRFKRFIEDHPNITKGSSDLLHNEWAKIVSNLNEESSATGINLITYEHKLNPTEEKESPVYEIKSNGSEAIGIINMFNVIARILPDTTLSIPWDSNKDARYNQIANKLDRLCELFSRKDITVTWKNESANNSKLINSDFMAIIFTINDKDVFKWIFTDGHFEIERISIAGEDWRGNFSYQDFQYPYNLELHNEWIAAMFPRSPDITKEKEYASFFPATVIYNSSLRTLEGIKKTILIMLDENKKSFYRLIIPWIQEYIQANNLYSIIEVIDQLGSKLYNPLESEEKVKKSEEAEQDKEEEQIWTLAEKLFLIAKKKKILPQDIVGLALKNNYFNAMKIFLRKAVNPDAQDEEGNAPLHLAISQNKPSAFKLLFEKHHRTFKTKVNIQNKNGNTPLHLAASQRDMEFVNTLIANKASITMRNNNEDTPFHLAVSKGNIDMLMILLEDNNKKKAKIKFNINAKNKDGNTLLHLAASQANMKIVDILIHNKADVNIQNNDENTPLHLAISEGNIDMLKILIDNKADINIQNNDKNTPLHVAISKGNIDMLRIILPMLPPLDLETINKDGNTFLHLAVLQENIDILKLLIERKINIDPRNNDDQTPLYLAAINLNVGAVEILLEHNADATTTSRNGKTLLIDIIDRIIRIGAIGKELWEGRRAQPEKEEKCIKIMDLLINKGANTDFINIENEEHTKSEDEEDGDGWSDDEDEKEKETEKQQKPIINYAKNKGFYIIAEFLERKLG